MLRRIAQWLTEKEEYRSIGERPMSPETVVRRLGLAFVILAIARLLFGVH